MSENVNHPKHYNQGKIEVIEYIEDKELGFHLGNAVKYISRAGKKDPAKEIEDLKKAIWYINRQIALVSGEEVPRPNDMNPRTISGTTTNNSNQSSGKPSPLNPPANQKEILSKFFKGDTMLIAKNAFEDGYKKGHEAGYNDHKNGKTTTFDPKLHVDRSIYGYMTEGGFGSLKTAKQECAAITRHLDRLAPNMNKIFVKITPIGEKE